MTRASATTEHRIKGQMGQPANRDYRVVGRFMRDSKPREEHVVNTFGDIDTYQSEGVVQFTLNGQALSLRPFTTRPKHFYIVFNDATSGNETYEAARFLTAELRDDGTTILDSTRRTTRRAHSIHSRRALSLCRRTSCASAC